MINARLTRPQTWNFVWMSFIGDCFAKDLLMVTHKLSEWMLFCCKDFPLQNATLIRQCLLHSHLLGGIPNKRIFWLAINNWWPLSWATGNSTVDSVFNKVYSLFFFFHLKSSLCFFCLNFFRWGIVVTIIIIIIIIVIFTDWSTWTSVNVLVFIDMAMMKSCMADHVWQEWRSVIPEEWS